MVRPDTIVTSSIVETRMKRTVINISRTVWITPSVHTDAHVPSTVQIVTSPTIKTGIHEAFVNILCAVRAYVQNDHHTADCCIAHKLNESRNYNLLLLTYAITHYYKAYSGL